MDLFEFKSKIKIKIKLVFPEGKTNELFQQLVA